MPCTTRVRPFADSVSYYGAHWNTPLVVRMLFDLPDFTIEVIDVRDLGDLTLSVLCIRGHGSASDITVERMFWLVTTGVAGYAFGGAASPPSAEALDAAGLRE